MASGSPTTGTSDKVEPSNSPIGSDDGESIEALNWSEFEDDDLLLAQEEIGKSGIFKSYLITDSEIKDSLALAADDQGHGDESELIEGENGEKIRKALRVRKFPTGQFQKVIRKDATTNEMISSTISDVSLNSLNENGSGSQAPVLDEGPIWAKSSNKSYRHRQNRTINQKLTFGVIIAVVLAFGIGLGNLIAYNECEAEYKSTTTTPPQESLSKQNPLPGGKESIAPADDNKIPLTDPYPILKQKKDEQKQSQSQQQQPDKKIVDEDKIVVKTEDRVPERENYHSKKIATQPKPHSQEPMVDPKYAQQAEILAKVVKSIDELSRKIDQFQNTTRQLGGIIMMKEDDFKPPFSTTEKPVTQNQAPADTDNSVDDQKLNKIIDEIKSYLDNNFKLDELEKSNILKGGEKVFEVLNEFLQVYKAENENILVDQVDKSESQNVVDPYEYDPIEPLWKDDETEEDVEDSFYDFLRSKSTNSDLESENPSLPPKMLEIKDDQEFDIEMIEFIKQLGKIKFHESLSQDKRQEKPLDMNVEEDDDIELEDDIILAALSNQDKKVVENIIQVDEDEDVIIEEVVDDDSFKYEEKKEKEEKRDNKNDKKDKKEESKSKTKKKNKWKGENSREFIKVDDDDDNDDDDDEGKKRHRKDFKKREKDQRKEYKHSKKEEKKYVDGKENSESKQDRNWLENRAQYRNDNRNQQQDKGDNDSDTDGNGESNYRNKGNKNNWQIKRDRIREKIRTKN